VDEGGSSSAYSTQDDVLVTTAELQRDCAGLHGKAVVALADDASTARRGAASLRLEEALAQGSLHHPRVRSCQRSSTIDGKGKNNGRQRPDPVRLANRLREDYIDFAARTRSELATLFLDTAPTDFRISLLHPTIQQFCRVNHVLRRNAIA